MFQYSRVHSKPACHFLLTPEPHTPRRSIISVWVCVRLFELHVYGESCYGIETTQFLAVHRSFSKIERNLSSRKQPYWPMGINTSRANALNISRLLNGDE